MAKNCENCGKEYSTINGIKLCDGNVVCNKCCQSIIDRNGRLKAKQSYFQKNLGVINLDEFKKMYESPELAAKCGSNEQLLASPFRREVAQHEFYFIKKQLWLSYVKKKIETTVLVYDDGLDITEVISTVNMQVRNYYLPIDSIQDYKAKIKMAKFPLVLIVLLFGFYHIDIWFVLLTILLLGWSYGREIVLVTKQGITYRIPVASKTDEVKQLLYVIEKAKGQPKEDMHLNKSTMFCAACGKPVSPNGNFCKHCGTKIK